MKALAQLAAIALIIGAIIAALMPRGPGPAAIEADARRSICRANRCHIEHLEPR